MVLQVVNPLQGWENSAIRCRRSEDSQDQQVEPPRIEVSSYGEGTGLEEGRRRQELLASCRLDSALKSRPFAHSERASMHIAIRNTDTYATA